MPKVRRKPIRWEDIEQKALVTWFKLQHPDLILFAIPNQLVRSSWQGRHMIELGLVPGMPDLFLCVPRGEQAGLFIELKRPEGVSYGGGHGAGRVSTVQASKLNYLNEHGYLAVVCYGWQDAVDSIEEYLKDV